MTEQQREQRGISRRTIAKGAAWAVPALPIVAATPAYASSGGKPTGAFLAGCKLPGGSCEKETGVKFGYLFILRINNNTGVPLYVYPTLANIPTPEPDDGGATLNPWFKVTSAVPFNYDSPAKYVPGDTDGTPLNQAELIPNGGSLTLQVGGESTNSAESDAAGTLFMAWGHTATPGADPDHPYSPTPRATDGATVTDGWFAVPINIASFPPCDDCMVTVPTPPA